MWFLCEVHFCLGHDCLNEGPQVEELLLRQVAGKAARLGARRLRVRARFTEKGNLGWRRFEGKFLGIFLWIKWCLHRFFLGFTLLLGWLWILGLPKGLFGDDFSFFGTSFWQILGKLLVPCKGLGLKLAAGEKDFIEDASDEEAMRNRDFTEPKDYYSIPEA